MDHTPTQRCTHLFLDDHTCGSPALRGELYCYYHHPTRRPCANPFERRARRGFHLPPPETGQQVLFAVGEIMRRVAANQIDVHRASVVLYSLQLISNSQRHPPFDPNSLPPT
jgi:hypothetical protein